MLCRVGVLTSTCSSRVGHIDHLTWSNPHPIPTSPQLGWVGHTIDRRITYALEMLGSPHITLKKEQAAAIHAVYQG